MGRESSHSAVTFPSKPKIHQQQNTHTPGSQKLTQAWDKNGIKMNKNLPKFKIIGPKRYCTIKRKLMINIKMALLLNQRSHKPLFLCFWLDFWDKRHAWSDEDIFRKNEGKSTFMQTACGLTLFQYLMNKLATKFDETSWSPISGVMHTVHEHWLSSTLFSRAWNNGNVQIKMHHMSFITVVHVQRLWYNHKKTCDNKATCY